MPVLQNIILQNFRNICFAELFLCPAFNCISGRNGQGKTNLLDAIHYLSMTKSSTGIQDQFCIRHGNDSFTVAGNFRMEDGMKSAFVITVDRQGKKIRRDDKAYKTLSAHIGTIPTVMVSPLDVELISDGGECRRRMVNTVISQIDPQYLAALQKYNRMLAQRNRLLKDDTPDDSLLDILDREMSLEANLIFDKRSEFTKKLAPAVQRHYKSISGNDEDVAIEYKSELGEPLEDILRKNRRKDHILGFTSSGVQRDDFIFSLDAHPIRKCGSQGQQKSFLIALKLSQADIIKEISSVSAILLLDDVFDKLDNGRIENLLEIVGRNEYGQIFITDTDRARLESIIGKISGEAAYFEARNGEF